MRALFLVAALLAGCSSSAPPVDAGGDLVDPNAGTRGQPFCPCPSGQLCVHPACCTFCYSRAPDAGCPMGQMPGGYCSNCTDCTSDDYCSQPCTANDPFCVLAPRGCDSLTDQVLHQICSNGNGGGNGTCGASGIACSECY